MQMSTFSDLGTLLSYPTTNYVGELNSLKLNLENSISPDDFQRLEEFISVVSKEELGRLEEMYTATFDIHGLCCLDVGYVLFGEDYKRGEFLVGINRVQRENNVDLGSELGDYLPNMLKLMGVIEEGEISKELINKILIPAIEQMNSKFSHSSDNPFNLVMKIINNKVKEYKSIENGTTGVYPC